MIRQSIPAAGNPSEAMRLIRYWQHVHRWPRRVRWPLKTAIFAVVVLLVLYPKVWLVPVWLQRLADLGVVLDPAHPGLAELEAAVHAAAGPDAPFDDLLAPLERVVCQRIPYAYDWDTWGVMDYLPTVDEVFTLGREDCDGRAVVAASLLRRLGYDAFLVSDVKHMWVVTRDWPAGQVGGEDVPLREIMAPGKGAKTLVGGEGGTRTTPLQALPNLLRGLAFGLTVFPLGRELIILAALCALTLHPRSSLLRGIIGCVLLAAALGLFRLAGASGDRLAAYPLLAWAGFVAAVGGWTVLALRAGVGRRPAAQPRSPAGDASGRS